MSQSSHIGIDLGGTNIRGGLVVDGKLSKLVSQPVMSQGTEQEVLHQLFGVVDQLMDNEVVSIGIGVPGLVDIDQGLVFDVVNIPSWKEIPLLDWMQNRYGIPILINNDANCFALGEYYYGKGIGHDSMVGITIGTGMGTGIIINQQLYTGKNAGAGEFGMVDYLSHTYEYYASGQFFQNVYNTDGGNVFHQAKQGNTEALLMYEEFGKHLGKAIKMILYSLDIPTIVLGGSVRHAWTFFQKTMWQQINEFAYSKLLSQLRIEISSLENAGILGAATLYEDKTKKSLRL